MAGVSFSQDASLQKLDSLAGKYITSLRQIAEEKVWLQTDRPVYSTGDIVWFKAFVANAVSHNPSRQSNILYVDLVDENDAVIRQFLLNAVSFKTDGSFVLADTLASGHYWLRAYTKKSLSSMQEPMGVQAIYLINSLKPDTHIVRTKTVIPAKISGDSVLVQFYPEGGTVVGGATTVLAVTTTDLNGNPLSVSGFLKDRDSLVATLQTNADGLGRLSYFSWTWHNYRLHIIRPDKKDLVYTVPPVNVYTAQLAVIEKDGLKKLRVVLEDSIYQKNKPTYVLGISGDSLCFSGMGKGSYDVVIPEYRFPKGMAGFVLFDEKGKLLSERNLNINKEDPDIKLSMDKTNYAAREKVNLSIEAVDADQKPLVASFSVEVNDVSRQAFYQPIKTVSTVDENKQASETQWLPSPKKYTDEELDLLMLTQNNQYTKRVIRDWEQQEKKMLTADLDSSFYIQGKIVDNRNRPIAKKIVTLFGDMQTKIFITDTTDANGHFYFPFTAYDDKTRFNLQVTDFAGRLEDAKIVLDTMMRIPKPSTPANLKQRFVFEEIETARKAIIIQSKKDTVMMKRGKEWLSDVTVTGLLKKDPGYDVKKRMSPFSRVIASEMLMRSGGGNLGNAIFRVPGIHLRNGYVTVNGGNSFAVGEKTEPMLVIDGMPVPTDTSDKISGSEPSPLMMALNRIDPALVDFIEVLTGPEAAIYGVRGGNGVIVVNTKSRLVIDDPNKVNGMRNLIVKGFHIPEIFEQRDYSIKENKNSKIPDTRSLIYWNGDGLTDANGKATVSFYTSDAATTYTVIVTGMTAKGFRFQKQIIISRK